MSNYIYRGRISLKLADKLTCSCSGYRLIADFDFAYKYWSLSRLIDIIDSLHHQIIAAYGDDRISPTVVIHKVIASPALR